MTQKEKIIKSAMALQSIRNTAKRIDVECAEYSRTAAMYAKNIVNECDSILKIL